MYRVTVQNVESDINCALKIEVYQILWLGMIYAEKLPFPMPIHLNYTWPIHLNYTWFHYSLYMMCLSLIMGYSDGLNTTHVHVSEERNRPL